MKHTLLLIANLIITAQLIGQEYGNGQVITKTIQMGEISIIDIQFNADISIDFESKNREIVITAEENVIPLIGIEVSNKILTLDQVRWVEPRIEPKIKIGVQALEQIYQGTHSSTTIVNINQEKLIVEGNVGKVNLGGSLDQLIIDVEGTDIDARQVVATKVDLRTQGDAVIKLGKLKELKSDLDSKSRVLLDEEPQIYLGASKAEIKRLVGVNQARLDIEWIDFKIKNNSWNRKHFYVVGPKANGKTFSYGFPMMPGSKRDERWTVGTEIYEESKLGNRTLLRTIKADDKGHVVDLF